jgi:hypothetical protein
LSGELARLSGADLDDVCDALLDRIADDDLVLLAVRIRGHG